MPLDVRCRSRQKHVNEDELYVWCDYVSIPQANKTLQSLSISSLTVYSSICRFFVIVCPPTLHADSGKVCDAATYQRRGWCRLPIQRLLRDFERERG